VVGQGRKSSDILAKRKKRSILAGDVVFPAVEWSKIEQAVTLGQQDRNQESLQKRPQAPRFFEKMAVPLERPI
jgi:hypothetical protein